MMLFFPAFDDLQTENSTEKKVTNFCSDYCRTYVQICARESLGRERLKATVKQPPVIDPRTGQEVILEPEGPSQDTTDDSDETSDIEAEYFEAEVGDG